MGIRAVMLGDGKILIPCDLLELDSKTKQSRSTFITDPSPSGPRMLGVPPLQCSRAMRTCPDV